VHGRSFDSAHDRHSLRAGQANHLYSNSIDVTGSSGRDELYSSSSSRTRRRLPGGGAGGTYPLGRH
jgi:hypothetical protein